eukprot:5062855-Pyramimonas_sp.AAC.1
MREHEQVPLYSNKSRGANIPKKLEVGPKGVRVVHVLPFAGKAFFSNKLKVVPAVADHGFVRHRRRENAVFVTLVSGWRARRLGCTYCNTFKDMGNAFASSDWEEIDTTISLAAAEHD